MKKYNVETVCAQLMKVYYYYHTLVSCHYLYYQHSQLVVEHKRKSVHIEYCTYENQKAKSFIYISLQRLSTSPMMRKTNEEVVPDQPLAKTLNDENLENKNSVTTPSKVSNETKTSPNITKTIPATY